MIKEFKDFLMRGNLVELAVAFVMGLAFAALVTSFVDNLVMVTGVIGAIRELGLRCPEDVAIVSSDDADWLDVFDPPITTIVQPSYELGVKAAELLLKRIRYPKRSTEKILLKPGMKVRGIR